MSLCIEFLSGADADLQEAFKRFEDYRDGFGAFRTCLCLTQFDNRVRGV